MPGEAKIQPHNRDAEVGVLGSILIEESTMDDMVDILSIGDFYVDAHKAIYRAMLNLYEAKKPIDLLTLSDELKKKDELEMVGGMDYISELTNLIPTAHHVKQYADIVRDKAIRRRLINLSEEASSIAHDENIPIEAAVDHVEAGALSLSKTQSDDKAIDMKELLSDAFRRLEQSQNGHTTSIPTKYENVDALLSGLHGSDLIILAARPGMGKTAFALNLAYNVAQQGKGVLIFSLEMGKEQLTDRLLAIHSGIETSRLHTRDIDDETLKKFGEAVNEMADLPLYIDDVASLTISQLRAKAKREKHLHDISFIIVDYLQLLSGTNRGGNRVQEISDISRGMKSIARELNVPVLALSQLSRSVEMRDNKRPQLSDLRDSGSIEQDADIVAFLYRDDYYELASDKQGASELLVRKHRNGPLGSAGLDFDKQHQKFTDAATPVFH